MFSDFVYQLGKRYGVLLDTGAHYPQFSGRVADLIGADLPDVRGEYVIAYQRGATFHHIRVYVEAGEYEATGLPASDGFTMRTRVE